MELDKVSFILTWLLLCHGCTAALPAELCKASKSLINTPGDAKVIGIFQSHREPNCTGRDNRGVHHILSAVQILHALNEQNFVPGIKLGMQLYDICTSPLSVQQTLVHGLVEIECDEAYSLGIIMTPAVSSYLHELVASLNVSVSYVHPQHCILAANLTASLLSALNWTHVQFVFTKSLLFTESFAEVASSKNICIQHSILGTHLDDKTFIDTTDLKNTHHLAIVFGTVEYILQILQASQLVNVNFTIQWIYVTVDVDHDLNAAEHLPVGSIVLSPREKEMKIIEESMQYLKDGNISTLMHNVSTNYSDISIIRSPFFLDVAYSFIDIACRLRTLVQKYCQSQRKSSLFCPGMPSFYNSVTSYTNQNCTFINDINKVVKIYSVRRIHQREYVGDIGRFQAENRKLTFVTISNISTLLNSVQFKGKDECKVRSEVSQEIIDHRTVSLQEYDTIILPLSWRQESWVAAIVSVATVGFLCSLAVCIFLLVRIFKGDVLEGNPCFSFLLLLSINCSYLSVIPFSLSSEEPFQGWLICGLRTFGTSISYALLFSIMLSRSFMLASCDEDGGFMSHVSGYLQSALLFFIVGVQIALSIQFWIMNSALFGSHHCSAIYKDYLFLLLLSYNMFLLLLLVCISPFVAKSKRNYREGMFFLIASFLCLIVFAAWCTAYIMFPSRWQDAAITGGLTGTATVILVTVFIPRTYLMMSAVVRDNITSSLPTLAFSGGASEQDVNYQSSQALYDTVAPQFVIQSQENVMKESNPVDTTEPKTSIQGRSTSPEYSYERYDSPPSPHKVTSF